MSERFLKYETEVENGMVDANGVLIPGGGSSDIVNIYLTEDPMGLHYTNGSSYEILKDAIDNHKTIIFDCDGDPIYGEYLSYINLYTKNIEYISCMDYNNQLNVTIKRYNTDNTITMTHYTLKSSL